MPEDDDNLPQNTQGNVTRRLKKAYHKSGLNSQKGILLLVTSDASNVLA